MPLTTTVELRGPPVGRQVAASLLGPAALLALMWVFDDCVARIILLVGFGSTALSAARRLRPQGALLDPPRIEVTDAEIRIVNRGGTFWQVRWAEAAWAGTCARLGARWRVCRTEQHSVPVSVPDGLARGLAAIPRMQRWPRRRAAVITECGGAAVRSE